MKWLSRKFLFACAVLGLSSLGLFVRHLSGSEFVTIVTVVTGAFFAAHGAQEWKQG